MNKIKNKVNTHKIKLIDGSIAIIKDTEKYKALKSEDYNFFFNKENGFFARWGKGNYTNKKKTVTKQELELFSLWSAIWNEKFNFKEFVLDLETDGSLDVTAVEILDWEISEKCDLGCSYCYKSNIATKGKNLDFESFKKTFHKLPPSITTIAYGIGSIHLCPDLFKILKYTREHGIIPTITINGIATDNEINQLVKYCGAVAVSIHKKEAYNTIKKLTDKGLKQCNIHAVISEETYSHTLDIISDLKNDPRLKKVYALIMLALKEKGRSIGKFHKLSQDKFNILCQTVIDNEINFGFDSCNSAKVFNFIDLHPEYDYMRTYIEPCESGIFSAYLSVGQLDKKDNILQSEYYPCSFTEKTDGWENGLKIKDDFMKDIWFNQKTQDFRNKVKKCRNCNIGCPIYDV